MNAQAGEGSMQLFDFANLWMNRRLSDMGLTGEDFTDESAQRPLGSTLDEQANFVPTKGRYGLSKSDWFDELAFEVGRVVR